MVFRDNIVYKNINTISKNHLILISNIPLTYLVYALKTDMSREKVQLTKENVYVTIYIIKRVLRIFTKRPRRRKEIFHYENTHSKRTYFKPF